MLKAPTESGTNRDAIAMVDSTYKEQMIAMSPSKMVAASSV